FCRPTGCASPAQPAATQPHPAPRRRVMLQVPCPKCGNQIVSNDGVRFPPWCVRCGADVKVGPEALKAATQVPLPPPGPEPSLLNPPLPPRPAKPPHPPPPPPPRPAAALPRPGQLAAGPPLPRLLLRRRAGVPRPDAVAAPLLRHAGGGVRRGPRRAGLRPGDPGGEAAGGTPASGDGPRRRRGAAADRRRGRQQLPRPARRRVRRAL